MAINKAILWEKLPDHSVRCLLCGHLCRISRDHYGICGMRQNINGELFTHAYGDVIANNVDPIEKKPFYHVLPGSRSYSIATIGCNFRCSFCQNWSISQVSARDYQATALERTPEDIVKEAGINDCKTIAYTYTEPTVFFEYAMDIAAMAKKDNIRNLFVTNGFMTRQAIDKAEGYIDAMNVDLKAFNKGFYNKICGADLEPVLESIKYLKEKGIWIEVTTLLITGMNDSDEELESIAGYIAGIDIAIPWHISRFHPDYKYREGVLTPGERILKAVEIGKKAGLRYVYPGNTGAAADTICPGCGKTLVERTGFHMKRSPLFDLSGKCGACGENIEGVWK